MSSKVARRGVSIFIDGKEVENSVKAITSELRKLQNEQRKATIGSEEYVKKGKSIAHLNNILNEHRQSLRSSANEYGKLGTLVKGVFGGGFLLAGVQKIGQMIQSARQFVSEGIRMASMAQGIDHAFNRIADKDYLDSLRKQTKGLVSDFVLMKSAVRAENFNIPLSQLGKLLEFAQNRARDTGESVDYLVESIINGIGRKSPLILDNLGISAVRLQEEVKKTGDFAAAVGTIIDDEMAKAGPAIDTATDAATRKKVAWENLQLATGKFFTGFKSGWDNFTTNFVNGLTEIISGQEKASVQFENQINRVADLNTSLPPLVRRYEELRDKAERSAEENEELNRVMTKITEIVPTAAIEFDKYGNVLELNTQKVWNFIDAETAKLEIMNKDAIKEQTKSLKEYENELAKVNKLRQSGEKSIYIQTSSFGTGMYQSVALTDDELRELDKQADELERNILGTQTYINELTGKTTAERIETRANEIRKEAEFNNMSKEELDKYIKNYSDQSDKFIQIAQKVYNHRFGSTVESPENKKTTKKEEPKQDDPFKAELNALKDSQKKEILLIKQGLLDKGALEDEFREEAFKKEIEHLRAIRQLYIDNGKDAIDIEMQITDRLIAEANRRYREKQAAEKKNESELAAIRKDAEETQKKEDADRLKFLADKRREIMDNVADEHKDLIEQLYDLNIDWLTNFLDEYGVMTSSIAQTGANILDTAINFYRAEELAIERKYDKQIKAARKAGRDTTKLEEKKEEEILKIRAKYADKQFILTVASVIASTAQAAINSFAAAAKWGGPIAGGIAAAAASAYGLSQIAIAREQHKAAKEGYFMGGFTGGEDPRKVRGYFPDGQPYHGGEFVVNNRGVSNPNIRPVLDAFDAAQRTGTINSMSRKDIARALNINTTGVASPAGSAATQDPYVFETINRLSETVQRLSDQIDEGINAYATISGDKGVAKKLDEFNRMTKTARG